MTGSMLYWVTQATSGVAERCKHALQKKGAKSKSVQEQSGSSVDDQQTDRRRTKASTSLHGATGKPGQSRSAYAPRLSRRVIKRSSGDQNGEDEVSPRVSGSSDQEDTTSSSVDVPLLTKLRRPVRQHRTSHVKGSPPRPTRSDTSVSNRSQKGTPCSKHKKLAKELTTRFKDFTSPTAGCLNVNLDADRSNLIRNAAGLNSCGGREKRPGCSERCDIQQMDSLKFPKNKRLRCAPRSPGGAAGECSERDDVGLSRKSCSSAVSMSKWTQQTSNVTMHEREVTESNLSMDVQTLGGGGNKPEHWEGLKCSSAVQNRLSKLQVPRMKSLLHSGGLGDIQEEPPHKDPYFPTTTKSDGEIHIRPVYNDLESAFMSNLPSLKTLQCYSSPPIRRFQYFLARPEPGRCRPRVYRMYRVQTNEQVTVIRASPDHHQSDNKVVIRSSVFTSINGSSCEEAVSHDCFSPTSCGISRCSFTSSKTTETISYTEPGHGGLASPPHSPAKTLGEPAETQTTRRWAEVSRETFSMDCRSESEPRNLAKAFHRHDALSSLHQHDNTGQNCYHDNSEPNSHHSNPEPNCRRDQDLSSLLFGKKTHVSRIKRRYSADDLILRTSPTRSIRRSPSFGNRSSETTSRKSRSKSRRNRTSESSNSRSRSKTRRSPPPEKFAGTSELTIASTEQIADKLHFSQTESVTDKQSGSRVAVDSSESRDSVCRAARKVLDKKECQVTGKDARALHTQKKVNVKLKVHTAKCRRTDGESGDFKQTKTQSKISKMARTQKAADPDGQAKFKMNININAMFGLNSLEIPRNQSCHTPSWDSFGPNCTDSKRYCFENTPIRSIPLMKGNLSPIRCDRPTPSSSLKASTCFSPIRCIEPLRSFMATSEYIPKTRKCTKVCPMKSPLLRCPSPPKRCCSPLDSPIRYPPTKRSTAIKNPACSMSPTSTVSSSSIKCSKSRTNYAGMLGPTRSIAPWHARSPASIRYPSSVNRYPDFRRSMMNSGNMDYTQRTSFLNRKPCASVCKPMSCESIKAWKSQNKTLMDDTYDTDTNNHTKANTNGRGDYSPMMVEDAPLKTKTQRFMSMANNAPENESRSIISTDTGKSGILKQPSPTTDKSVTITKVAPEPKPRQKVTVTHQKDDTSHHTVTITANSNAGSDAGSVRLEESDKSNSNEVDEVKDDVSEGTSRNASKEGSRDASRDNSRNASPSRSALRNKVLYDLDNLHRDGSTSSSVDAWIVKELRRMSTAIGLSHVPEPHLPAGSLAHRVLLWVLIVVLVYFIFCQIFTGMCDTCWHPLANILGWLSTKIMDQFKLVHMEPPPV